MRRIPALIAAARFCRVRSRGANAVRLRRVQERAADARSKNKDIRDDHEANAPSRGPFIPGFRRRRRAIGHPTQFTSFRGGRIGATTSRLQLRCGRRAGCHRRSADPQGGNRISEMGRSCMTARSRRRRKRLLNPTSSMVSQRAAGRSRHASMSRHFDDAEADVLKLRENQHDQVEQ